MLTDSETIAVRTILGNGALPSNDEMNFAECIATMDADDRERVVDLRDEIDALIRKEKEETADVQKTADAIDKELTTLESAAENLIYKIKEKPADIEQTYEFKELKAELGIY